MKKGSKSMEKNEQDKRLPSYNDPAYWSGGRVGLGVYMGR